MLSHEDQFHNIQYLEIILRDLKSNLANEMVKLTLQPEQIMIASEQVRVANTILELSERIRAIEKKESIH